MSFTRILFIVCQTDGIIASIWACVPFLPGLIESHGERWQQDLAGEHDAIVPEERDSRTNPKVQSTRVTSLFRSTISGIIACECLIALHPKVVTSPLCQLSCSIVSFGSVHAGHLRVCVERSRPCSI
eukprot:5572615-Amphidinium_carterae.1